jgi:hypothetical protein
VAPQSQASPAQTANKTKGASPQATDAKPAVPAPEKPAADLPKSDKLV